MALSIRLKTISAGGNVEKKEPPLHSVWRNIN
jgi:hypothetical protein